MFEVAAGADAGEAGAVADFLGGEVVLGGAQRVDDEFERHRGQSFGQGGAGSVLEELVDFVLVEPGSEALDVGAAGEVFAHAVEERGAGEGFDEVVVDAAGHGLADGVAFAGGGDGDDVDGWAGSGAQAGEDFESGDVGQVDVEQDEVGVQGVDGAQCLAAAVCFADDGEVGECFEEAAVDGGDGEVVVHDEGAHGLRVA